MTETDGRGGDGADATEGAPPTPPTGRAGATAPRPPRRLRAFLIGVVLAAGLAVLLFVVIGTTSSRTGTGGVVPVGATAPDFTLPSAVGAGTVDLAALGSGRHHPVVLNFFASWCIPCRSETPLLASTASAERARGSVIQFVGVDEEDPVSSARTFIRQAGISYPVGRDPNVTVTSGLYGLPGPPQTMFIDESGVVVGHIEGPVTKAQLDGWVHRLTGGG